MAQLEQELRERISQHGPLSIAEYMTICLTHPEHGYYTSGYPVGGRAPGEETGGDFITAPEISQMFGELIGIWCMEVWNALDRPSPFTLAEIGPGRGTLMKDLLRAGKALPGFLDAADIHLIEISPTLSGQQGATLEEHRSRITWIGDIADLPARPTILIGNEFLDALPFHQWIKSDGPWLERGVGLIEQDGNDKLGFVTLPSTLPMDAVPARVMNSSTGDIFETSPTREAFVATVAAHIALHQGAALLIDYGHGESAVGDTFQAIANHAFADPLETPGTADLTSHVDFQPLAEAARTGGCTVSDITTQGEFLLNLGLLQRAGALGSGQDEQVQQSLRKAAHRLAGPDQMGDLFKVMALGAPTSLKGCWPGFDRGQ